MSAPTGATRRRAVPSRPQLAEFASRWPLFFFAATAVGLAACRSDVAPFESADQTPEENPLATQLTSSPGDERTPSWSAGGDSVYYSAQEPFGFSGHPGVLMAIAREGGAAVPVLTNVQFPGAAVRWLVAPALRPTGESLAYIEIGPLWEPGLPVCLMLQPGFSCGAPLADTAPPLRLIHVRLRDLAATGPLEDDPALLVNLDGVSQNSPSLPRSFVVNDYPFQQLFRDERALIFGPSWSPDGQRLVFSDGLQLLTWTISSNIAEPVPGTEDAIAPTWSPDGERIAFFHVERADSINGVCVRIALGDVVCEMDRTIYSLGRRVLSWVRPDGSGLAELGEGEDPAWSPDGSAIYFRRADQIWRRTVDGSDTTPIPFTESGRSPSISPDGQRLAFSKLSPQGDYDIWVIALDSLP